METVELKSSKGFGVIAESRQNHGRFTGVIDSVPSLSYVSGNGVLELKRNGDLKAIYTDVYPPSTVESLMSIGDYVIF